MSQKNTNTFSHEDILKIIRKKTQESQTERLAEKKKILDNDIKSAQKESKKPISVLLESYKVEIKESIKERPNMITKIKETVKEIYELGKELVTLKSPLEVYIFISGVWIAGVLLGTLAS